MPVDSDFSLAVGCDFSLADDCGFFSLPVGHGSSSAVGYGFFFADCSFSSAAGCDFAFVDDYGFFYFFCWGFVVVCCGSSLPPGG